MNRVRFSLALAVAVLLFLAPSRNIRASSQVSEEAAGQSAEQAGKLREAFMHYLAAYQALSWDSDSKRKLEKKVIDLVLKLDPRPAVPEEAERRMARGKAALKVAQNSSDYESARQEFLEAINQAPWWADAHYNLAVVRERQNEYQKAINSFKTYLLTAPAASDAKEVKAKIYELEYLSERAERAKADEEREREARQRAEREEQRRQEEAQRPERLTGTWRLTKYRLSGDWNDDCAEFQVTVRDQRIEMTEVRGRMVDGRACSYCAPNGFRGRVEGRSITGTRWVDQSVCWSNGRLFETEMSGSIEPDGNTIHLSYIDTQPAGAVGNKAAGWQRVSKEVLLKKLR